MSLKSLRTLVLNSDGRPQGTWPLNIVDVRDAAVQLWQGKAVLLETWPDEFVRAPSWFTEAPKTVMLREYVKPATTPKFCRRSVYLRDGFRCQYCGETFTSDELSYDHVVPRAKGGRTVWNNITSACTGCNARKSNRTCQEAGMYPLTKPYTPTSYQLLEAGLKFLPNDIRDTWRDFLYWNGELAE